MVRISVVARFTSPLEDLLEGTTPKLPQQTNNQCPYAQKATIYELHRGLEKRTMSSADRL
jgi:hypothetical protein